MNLISHAQRLHSREQIRDRDPTDQPTESASITSGTSMSTASSTREAYPFAPAFDCDATVIQQFADAFVFVNAQALKRLRRINQVGDGRR